MLISSRISSRISNFINYLIFWFFISSFTGALGVLLLYTLDVAIGVTDAVQFDDRAPAKFTFETRVEPVNQIPQVCALQSVASDETQVTGGDKKHVVHLTRNRTARRRNTLTSKVKFF